MDWNDLTEVFAALDAATKIADIHTQEIFGDKDTLPDDEMEIVWDDRLYPTHQDKVTALRVLRAGKKVKPKSFAKRMTRAGRISAQGMGIRLD